MLISSEFIPFKTVSLALLLGLAFQGLVQGAPSDDKNSTRQDLKILLNLPEETAKESMSRPAIQDVQNCAAQYQKGIELYNQGVTEFNAGRAEQALLIFQQVLDIFPLHKNTYTYILKCMGRLQSDSKVLLEKSNRNTDARNDSLYQIGLTEYQKQNFAEAVRIWARLIQTSPEYRKAFEALRMAQDKLDEIAKNFLDQGTYFYQKGEVARALSEWERGRLLCPDDPKLKAQVEAALAQSRSSGERILAECEVKLREKKYDEALKVLNGGLQQYPDQKMLKDKLKEVSLIVEKSLSEKTVQAKTLLASGKSSDALSILRGLLQMNPESPILQEMAKQAEESVAADFKKSVTTDLLKEAESALSQGRYFEALDKFREIEKQDAALTGLQDKIKAVQNGINAVETRKKTASGFNRGLDLFNGGQYQSALKEWRSALKESPDNEMLKLYIEEAEKRSKEGTDLQKVKNQKEAEATRLGQAGLEQFQRKNFDEACKSLEKAVELDPENSAIRKTLKTCRKEAIKEQEKLTPENEKKVDRLFLDGINLYRDGQYKKAVETWKQVLTLKPDHKKAQTYITNVTQKLQKIESI